MEPLIDTRIQHWIERLDERFAGAHKKMDFAPWAVFVAYDIISEVGFGRYLLLTTPRLCVSIHCLCRAVLIE